MTVPPSIPPRTSPPRYRVLDDAWEAPPSHKPRRLRVVVVAASIGTALIMACVAILKSSERTDPVDPSAWVQPAPPPYAILPENALRGERVTPPSLSGVEQPPPAPPAPPARPARPAPSPRQRPTQRVVGLAGYLSINSSPWAELSVDGRVVGSTPQIRVRVSPGRHHLLLVREGFKTHDAWVDVIAGGTVRITNITLEKDAQ